MKDEIKHLDCRIFLLCVIEHKVFDVVLDALCYSVRFGYITGVISNCFMVGILLLDHGECIGVVMSTVFLNCQSVWSVP